MNHESVRELIFQSNDVSRGRFCVSSVWAQRLIIETAARVSENDTPSTRYEIPIKTILSAIGYAHNPGGDVYRDLEDAAMEIIKSVVKIRRGNVTKIFAPLSVCIVDRDRNVVTTGFTFEALPHYQNLKREYTCFQRQDFLGLRTRRSQDLYRFIQSWINREEGYVELSRDDLFDLLNVSQALRTKFSRFYTTMLLPAIEEINEKTQSHFFAEPIKGGSGGRTSRVEKIRIYFSAQIAKQQKQIREAAIQRETEKLKDMNAKEAEACWQRTAGNCTINRRLGKCRYCTTQGRMWARMILNQTKDEPEQGKIAWNS